MNELVKFQQVLDAYENIKSYVKKTPMIRAEKLDELVGAKVYLKLENLQITGSFKLRGATNKVLNLSEAERERGIVAASSGNHAQAAAYIAAQLGVKSTIVMPEDAPKTKVDATASYGATIVKAGFTGLDRDAKAEELIEENGYVLVHSHADPDIIAGQGTVAIEILEEVSDIDYIIVPCGAGGLISGVSLAAKSIKNDVKIIGVEPENVARYSASLEEGHATSVAMGKTIADGLRVSTAKDLNYRMIKTYTDELVTIDDESIKVALKSIVFGSKVMIEASAAVGVAAAIAGKLPIMKDDKVCFVMSGGNIDPDLFMKLYK